MGLLRALPRVSHCCCCIDLRSGVIVIGILSLVGCLMNIATATMSIVAPPDLGAFLPSNVTAEDVRVFKGLVTNLTYGFLVWSIIGMFFAVILLVGAVQRRILFLRFYLTVLLIALVLFIVGNVAFYFSFWPGAMLVTIVLSIDCYFFLCINSYLQHLVDVKNGVTNVQFKAVPQA